MTHLQSWTDILYLAAMGFPLWICLYYFGEWIVDRRKGP